jgi:hypothetical protein
MVSWLVAFIIGAAWLLALACAKRSVNAPGGVFGNLVRGAFFGSVDTN